jgi:hypothetical protein
MRKPTSSRALAVASLTAAFALLAALPPAGAEVPSARTVASAGSRGEDAVLLRNGGVLKGTITELAPGDAVTIVLLTGETRRLPMAQVAYAGPAANLPVPGGAAAPDRQLVRLELRGNKAGLTFFMRGDYSLGTTSEGESRGVGAQHYRRLCTTPCEAYLPPGSHMMALSPGPGAPADVDEVVYVGGPSTLEGKHTSNGAVRAVGWVVTLGAVGVGFYLIISGLLRSKTECTTTTAGTLCEDKPDIDTTRVAVGGGVLVGGVIIGGLLQGVSDGASVRVFPAAPGAVGTRRGLAGGGPDADLGARGAGAAFVPGLTLGASF